MTRVSSVKRLPAEIREEVNSLLDAGRSLDEIVSHLRELGEDVSRSALGRYKKRMEKVGERIRRSREVADSLVRNLGKAPESKSARLNVELMHSVIMEMVGRIEEGGDEDLDPMGAMLLSKAIDHLTRAKKADAEYTQKLKEAARQEALKEAAEAVESAAKTQGLDAEQAKFWREQVLGVR